MPRGSDMFKQKNYPEVECIYPEEQISFDVNVCRNVDAHKYTHIYTMVYSEWRE